MARDRIDVFRFQTLRRIRAGASFAAVPLLLAFGSAPHVAARDVERIASNDNRTAAGVLRGGVLTVHLDARAGEWRPDGAGNPGVVVHAFAEAGRPLQIPGPLIRVPRGTEIRAIVRNTLDSALVVHGLYTRGGPSADTVQIAPGATREVRFAAGTPGTYYYWASTSLTARLGLRGSDSQLAGALIIDGDATPAVPRDRVLVLGFWTPKDSRGIVARDEMVRFVINGRTWPNTERLGYTVGDSVRMRIVNVGDAVHPMHLHGFYFNVDTRGGEGADTVLSQSPHLVVTERTPPGRTFTLTWVPERAGNWLFHCHDNLHVLRNRPFDGTTPTPEHLLHVKNHAMEMMGGLVMGIEVRPRGPSAATADAGRRRPLRLIARVDSGGTDADPAYGYLLADGATTTPARGPLLPGPTIVLTRGEPVSITVVNRLPEATAVHWHGIELESYYDGVAGFSGTPTHVSPAIAPGDSFEARFTPRRAGTFMYHPHADEVRQQQAGLSGVIVVLEPGERYDPERDLVYLLSTPRRTADAGVIFVNGTSTPAPRELRVGERYRIRVVNLHTARPSMIARFTRDSIPLAWRAIAKDGMVLPRDQATARPAVLQIGNGEAYDFELVPDAPGDATFTVHSAAGARLVTQSIRVR
jgi:FtsP/CotA-like multicopper oxidase with cupredoxin domain